MNAPATAASLQKSAPHFQMVPLDQIKLSATSLQILRRSHFNKQALAELAADVKAHGVMQPILVREVQPAQGNVRFELVAGERRFMASRTAGLTDIPAMTRQISDIDMVEMQIAENLQRENLHPLEEAEGFQLLCAIHKCAAKDLVAKVGKNEAHIYARLKLLNLCPQVKEEFYADKFIASIALEIARIPDPKMQQQAAKGCITGDDLGEFYRDASGPLLYEEAREYIATEFMLRVDGNRAIEQARKDKKPVIAGDDAVKIWRNEASPPNGYIRIDAEYWAGNTRKQFADILGADPEGVVLIQRPSSGEAVKCLPRARVIEIFIAKKATLPDDMKQRDLPLHKPAGSPPPSTPAFAKSVPTGVVSKVADAKKAAADAAAKQKLKEERDARKIQLDIDIQIAVFRQVRAKVPKKAGRAELRDIIALLETNAGNSDCSAAIAPRPKSLDKCQERELLVLILDYLYAHEIEQAGYNSAPLMAAAKRYSVNAGKITKDLTAAFEERERGLNRAPAIAKVVKPMAKKKATKK